MNKKTSTTVAVIACLLVGAIPVAVSFRLSQQQSLQAEQERLIAYASDVLFRSERTAQQAYSGIDRLIHAQSGDPCSDSQLRLMAEIDVTSIDIQTMGFVADGKLMCSSFGRYGAGVVMAGNPPVLGTDGASLRTRVQLPFAPGKTFIVVERKGYAAVLDEGTATDVQTEPGNVSLATFSPTNHSYRSVRGPVQQSWIDHEGVDTPTAFIEGGFLVAVVKSKRYATKTLAAMPLTELHQRTGQVTRYLLPFGLAAGAALALLVFLLARRQMAMPAVLRAALRKRELFLLYQPIVDLQSRKTIGAEALVRWRRSDGSMVAPDVFIPIAESSGLIRQVTSQVLEMVTRDAQGLFRAHPDFHIGINLSAADLKSRRTPELLRQLMKDTAAGPRNLLVEATERGLMDAEHVRQIIHDIRALGIEVAIDDFGTGYSSLSYLGTFELDYLKIDKSFVDTLNTGAATSDVALHIIEMAKALKLKMIAEGVETEPQAQLLAARGVQYAQGWLFARPMSMDALKIHLAAPEAPAN